jgi:hypothetical protein
MSILEPVLDTGRSKIVLPLSCPIRDERWPVLRLLALVPIL